MTIDMKHQPRPTAARRSRGPGSRASRPLPASAGAERARVLRHARRPRQPDEGRRGPRRRCTDQRGRARHRRARDRVARAHPARHDRARDDGRRRDARASRLHLEATAATLGIQARCPCGRSARCSRSASPWCASTSRAGRSSVSSEGVRRERGARRARLRSRLALGHADKATAARYHQLDDYPEGTSDAPTRTSSAATASRIRARSASAAAGDAPRLLPRARRLRHDAAGGMRGGRSRRAEKADPFTSSRSRSAQFELGVGGRRFFPA